MVGSPTGQTQSIQPLFDRTRMSSDLQMQIESEKRISEDMSKTRQTIKEKLENLKKLFEEQDEIEMQGNRVS